MKHVTDVAFQEALKREVFENDVLPEDVRQTRGVRYTASGAPRPCMDIYDRTDPPTRKRPAIVFLHGGCWMFGGPEQFFRQASYLARKHGFFAVSVDYRLSGEARFPAALQDAKCAVRWLRAHADEHGIDTERIAMAGGSAGGHLTAMAAVSASDPGYEGDGGYADFPSHVQLAIPINGEFDLWDLLEKGSLIDAMDQFLGGGPDGVVGDSIRV